MQQEDQFASKWRIAKACARCHRLKSKCVYEDPTFQTCKRCFNLRLRCSVDEDPTAVNARKRKHTRSHQQVASRIAKSLETIEKELEFFEERSQKENSEYLPQLSLLASRLNSAGARLTDTYTLHDKNKTQLQLPGVAPEANLAHELIHTHMVLSENEARRRFNYFIEEMHPFFPISALSKSLHDYDTLLQTDSILLLACIYITTVNDNGLSDERPSKEANRRLHDTLDHYLTAEVSKQIFDRATGFTYRLSVTCLILSLWAVPSEQKGQFRSQVDLINAHVVSLCADVGNVSTNQIKALADDSSLERNNLRTLLSVYSCCGSLSFCLPRFRVVSWCLRHDIAIKQLLSRHGDRIPTREDIYLCAFTRLVRKGQEIFDHFISNGVTVSFLSADSSVKIKGPSQDTTLANVTRSMESFKADLAQILADSGLIDPRTLIPFPDAEFRKYSLIFVYNQLMLMNHDTLLSWQIFHMKPDADNSQIIPLIKLHAEKFKEACYNILTYYIEMNQISSKNYPTWMQYRCVHALISLVRLLILIKTKGKGFEIEGFEELSQKMNYYTDSVLKILDTNVKAYDSVVSDRVKSVVERIVKWKRVVESPKSTMKLDYINITQSMKGQEMEKLMDPTSAPTNDRKRMKIEAPEDEVRDEPKTSDSVSSFETEAFLPQIPDLTMATSTEIFKDFDRDFLRFFNPTEFQIGFDEASLLLNNEAENGYNL